MFTSLNLILITSLVFGTSAVTQEGGGSTIQVLAQEEDKIVIVVHSQEDEPTIIRVRDGLDVQDSRIPAQSEHIHHYQISEKGNPLSVRLLEISLIDSNDDVLVSEQSYAVEPWKLPNEPSLSLLPSEIIDLKDRWLQDPRAGRELDKLKNRSDKRLQDAAQVPATGGAWTQLYRCPDTKVYLEMISFTLHQSPRTGSQFSGYPYDECITTFRHRLLGVQAYEMALTFALTDDMRYGERAKQILMDYAARYPNYEYHDRNNNPFKGGGKAFPLSLDEAEWLVDITRAFDLLKGSGLLSGSDQQQIIQGVLRPAIEVIQITNIGIHNIQIWHNSALFLAGMQARDYVTARTALRGPTGFEQQLAQGLQSDGLWWENSLGYHFNALRGMLPMIQGVIRTPMQIDISPIEQMLVSAFELIQPDYSLPQLNDGTRESFFSGLRDEYEEVIKLFPNSARLDDPISIFGRGRTLSAILYGPAEITREGWDDVTSLLCEGAGLAVLRSGPHWQRTHAILDFGTHGGGHGHYDKLGLILWMQGAEAIRECGADGYGNPISDIYFRSTLAHSTVVVNGLNQAETEGELGYFTAEDEASTVTGSANNAYSDADLRRLIHTTEEGHFADMFEVSSETVHTVDYVIHGQGVASTSLTMAPSNFGFGGSYAFLKNVQSAATDSNFEITFEMNGKSSTLMVLGEAGTTVFLADSPGFPLGSQHPVVVVRRTTDRTVFASVMSEGSTLVGGLGLQLIDDGIEPILLLDRIGENEIRSLSFVSDIEN